MLLFNFKDKEFDMTLKKKEAAKVKRAAETKAKFKAAIRKSVTDKFGGGGGRQGCMA